jgi:hypothetical protein
MTTVTQGNSSTFTFTGADSIAITLAQGTLAHARVLSAAGLQKYSNAISESRTIGPFATGDVLTITAARGSIDYAAVLGDARTLSANYTLKASDDQTSFSCTAALTVSIPDGLSPRPTVTIVPPPTGNLSIAMLGAETLNGALTTLTRTRANNPAGIVVAGYRDAAAYGASGT